MGKRGRSASRKEPPKEGESLPSILEPSAVAERPPTEAVEGDGNWLSMFGGDIPKHLGRAPQTIPYVVSAALGTLFLVSAKVASITAVETIGLGVACALALVVGLGVQAVGRGNRTTAAADREEMKKALEALRMERQKVREILDLLGELASQVRSQVMTWVGNRRQTGRLEAADTEALESAASTLGVIVREAERIRDDLRRSTK